MDSDISAHLNAGLNGQGTYKNEQTQKDYDVHDKGLKWISFAVSTRDHLVHFTYPSVYYVFFGWREELDRV